MILLGLAGAAGSGKDAVADYLVQRYGFIKFSFSDALYREVAAAFGLPDESLLRDRETKEKETPLLTLDKCADGGFRATVFHLVPGLPGAPMQGEGKIPTFPLSPRQILQWWGTEYRRAQDPGYWVARAREFMYAVHKAPPYSELRPQCFVNTSVRFENERRFIQQLYGTVWHLRRDAAAPVASHESETPLPVLEGEREIFNNHTLDYLHMGVDQLLSTSAKFVRLEPPMSMVEPAFPSDPEGRN
jgi:hypothetical protein